ncbi:MAG: hypothetical protein U0414_02945 [Polyangiaceae bacterium]
MARADSIDHWLNCPLLAFVERNEPSASDVGHTAQVVLDLMRFDALPGLLAPNGWAEAIAKLPTAVALAVAVPREIVAGWDESSWMIIELRRSDADTPLSWRLHMDLADDAPATVELVSWTARTGIGAAANRAVGYSRIPIATDKALAAALAILQAELAAVYEVGQGVCQALCNSSSQPLAYVDFGGGCLANASSYPTHLVFCYAQNPIVVLSHWDFDHWRSALASPGSLSLTWIAPKQKWGPTAGSFVGSLRGAGGTLLLWGRSSSPALPGHLSIARCTGSSRNDSGLAVKAAIRRLGVTSRALFPGDARYTAIPAGLLGTLDHLVASHHGSGLVGTPPAAGRDVVYSFGINRAGTFMGTNSHGHPDRRALATARTAGWHTRHDTAAGHVGLWPQPGAVAGRAGACPTCVGCSLGIVQP